MEQRGTHLFPCMNEDVLTTLAAIVVPITFGCLSCFKKSSVAAIDGCPSIYVTTISSVKILLAVTPFFSKFVEIRQENSGWPH